MMQPHPFYKTFGLVSVAALTVSDSSYAITDSWAQATSKSNLSDVNDQLLNFLNSQYDYVIDCWLSINCFCCV